MKTIMKKRIIWLMAILSVLALLTAGTVLLVTAETPVPTIDILGQNLVFENNIYIKYAVKIGGIENPEDYSFGMLYWTDPQTSYEKGSEDLSETSTATETVAEQLCYIFTYKKLAAKEMTDDVYARAYIEVDGNIYYSGVQKYSILQYAYNKLGITGNNPSKDENFKTLLRDMLQYGASSQIYFNHRTERLATSEAYQIKVVGGILTDGTYSGLYAVGESVTMKASETNAEGLAFSHWTDSSEAIVGTDLTFTATVSSKHETYTAVYGEASAETPAEYFYFTLLDDGTYSVEANDPSNMPEELIIPTEHDGKPVTTIADMGFADCTGITSVIIPNGITTIGGSAFWKCTALASATISDSVTGIGNSAFYQCSALSEIAIPNGVNAIGDSTFEGCSLLKAISIGTGVQSIGNKAFYECKKLAAVVIPDGVKSIGENAFYNCDGITALTIGNGVQTIGSSAFYDCDGLTGVIIPDSVTTIGHSVFKSCFALNSLALGNGITTIPSDAFYDCSKLTSVIIPDSVTQINDEAFYNCRGLTSVTLSKNLTSLSSSAFTGCTNLIETVRGVSYVDTWVIDADTSISSARLREGTVGIGSSAFSGCTGLTSITIPDSVTSIGVYAFSSCGLTSITIPDSVTSIGVYAFSSCGLTSITIPDSVTSIDNYAFSCCSSLTSITIPDSVTSIGMQAFERCKSLTSVNIGNNVKHIGKEAFWNCTSLTSITIGNSVTSIEQSAFNGCTSLTSITIPDSVTSIGYDAFDACYRLVEIYNCSSLDIQKGDWSNGSVGYYALNVYTPTVGESKLHTTDDGYVFYADDTDCYLVAYRGSETDLTLPENYNGRSYKINQHAFWYCTNLTNITIPDSVTSIGRSAFSGCTSLTSITIPDSVTSIGDYAFSGCSNLSTVYYIGTASEWGEISIDSNSSSYLTSAPRYYYSETEPTDTTKKYWHYVDGIPTAW